MYIPYSEHYNILYKNDKQRRCYLCDKTAEYQIGRHEATQGSDILRYLMPMCGYCIYYFKIQYKTEPLKSETTPKIQIDEVQSHGLENASFDF